MDELLAEMNPMGDDSDDEKDIDEAMEEMEEDLDEDERGEMDDEEEEEEAAVETKKGTGRADSDAGRLEQEKRTVFVTNVAVTTKKKKLTSVFKKFGAVESVRFRNVSFSKGGKFVPIFKPKFAFIMFRKLENFCRHFPGTYSHLPVAFVQQPGQEAPLDPERFSP